jgi:hypothetical protein
MNDPRCCFLFPNAPGVDPLKRCVSRWRVSVQQGLSFSQVAAEMGISKA